MDFVFSMLKLLMRIALLLTLGLIIVAFIVRNPILDLNVAEKFRPPVDVEQLRAHVEALASITPARNFENRDSLDRAAEYVRNTWQAQGHTVVEQVFQVDGHPFRNLIVSVGPKDASDRMVFGAHYDVAGEQPGADDNASGIAALLELTRMMAKESPPKTRIDFVAYTLEEPPNFATGRMGSVVHADSLKAENVDVRLMVSIEMIGYFSDDPDSQKYPFDLMELFYPNRGNFIGMIGSLKGFGIVRRAKDAIRSYSTINVYSINAPESFPGVELSDHRSYWKHGYPAIMITDTAFFRNPNYHQPGDRPETLDYQRMMEVVRGLYGIIRAF